MMKNKKAPTDAAVTASDNETKVISQNGVCIQRQQQTVQRHTERLNGRANVISEGKM